MADISKFGVTVYEPPEGFEFRPTGWRYIDTAPKDKTIILVFDGDKIDIVQWINYSENCPLISGGAWFCIARADTACDCSYEQCVLTVPSPTHWMPLPEPPK